MVGGCKRKRIWLRWWTSIRSYSLSGYFLCPLSFLTVALVKLLSWLGDSLRRGGLWRYKAILIPFPQCSLPIPPSPPHTIQHAHFRCDCTKVGAGCLLIFYMDCANSRVLNPSSVKELILESSEEGGKHWNNLNFINPQKESSILHKFGDVDVGI